jgi:hypothetical protein
MILKSVPVTGKTAKAWLPLLLTGDIAARRLAVEKLAVVDSKDVATALLRQLWHPDLALHQEVVKALGAIKHGREALMQALLAAESPDDAWNLARTQLAIKEGFSTDHKKRVFSLACEYLESGDRRADPLLFLLRESEAERLRDRLEERALNLRKKKKYAPALVYLRLLGRDPACAESLRFEAAGCGLKISEHDLAQESRSADPALQQFVRLIHSHDIDPITRLKQTRWLEAEDLFYLGFNFVEGDKPEREFGGQVLRLLLDRWPRAKMAKDARSKLRSAGLK